MCVSWARAALVVLLVALASGGCSGHETDVNAVTEVRGELVFEDVDEPIHGATLVVSLDDVGPADADARTVTSQTHTGVTVSSADDRIDFALRASGLDQAQRYVVQAHLDVAGDGTVAVGDYITMESYPVDPSAPGRDMEVRLRPVRS